jgi:D-glycero-alpha-D-manno-heptose-7-phosphate kinase
MERTKEKQIIKELDHLCALTRQAHTVLEGEDTEQVIRELGAMIHESWMTKRSLSSSISNDDIDSIYETVRNAGAVGGKLCGAGGGGFFLVLAPPDKAASVQKALGERQLIPITMDDSGSTIIVS